MVYNPLPAPRRSDSVNYPGGLPGPCTPIIHLDIANKYAKRQRLPVDSESEKPQIQGSLRFSFWGIGRRDIPAVLSVSFCSIRIPQKGSVDGCPCWDLQSLVSRLFEYQEESGKGLPHSMTPARMPSQQIENKSEASLNLWFVFSRRRDATAV